MFYKHSRAKKIAILIVYVDDIILIGDHYKKLKCLKKKLATKFKIRDMGTMKYFHGMEASSLRTVYLLINKNASLT